MARLPLQLWTTLLLLVVAGVERRDMEGFVVAAEPVVIEVLLLLQLLQAPNTQ
jgi:hypothetical protein